MGDLIFTNCHLSNLKQTVCYPSQLSYSTEIQDDDSYDYSSRKDPNHILDPSYIQPLMKLLASLDTNTTVDLARPHLRQIFRLIE